MRNPKPSIEAQTRFREERCSAFETRSESERSSKWNPTASFRLRLGNELQLEVEHFLISISRLQVRPHELYSLRVFSRPRELVCSWKIHDSHVPSSLEPEAIKHLSWRATDSLRQFLLLFNFFSGCVKFL
jgi:hypothetical protein